jgi:hypothetical protein
VQGCTKIAGDRKSRAIRKRPMSFMFALTRAVDVLIKTCGWLTHGK